MEATKTDSPHGSGEASYVLYDDNPLVDFMLNNFRPIVKMFNGNIIVLNDSLGLKTKSCHHSATNLKKMICYRIIKHMHQMFWTHAW